MSIEELKKLLNSKNLINNTVHKANTNSVGFCFMKYDEMPEEAYKYLSGVVSKDLCVVFETKKRLRKSFGIYADPYGYFFDTVVKDEYCINKYNLKEFQIIKLAIPKSDGKWKWYTNINIFLKDFEKRKKKEEEKDRRIQKINESEKEYKKMQAKKFEEFIDDLNNKRKIEMKIDNKFYKFKAYIDSIECEDYSDILNIKIII